MASTPFPPGELYSLEWSFCPLKSPTTEIELLNRLKTTEVEFAKARFKRILCVYWANVSAVL